MHKSISFHIEGVSPLLLHNLRLADPLSEWSKAISAVSGKRKKTDDDHAEMSRLEWYGGLYTDEDNRVVVPGELIEGMLVKSAKYQRQGDAAKAGLLSDGNWPILHDGPQTLDEMWASGRFIDRRGVKVKQARVMRTRPAFHSWALKFDVHYLSTMWNKQAVIDLVSTAGVIVGIGDYRPKFGRFNVKEAK